MLKHSKERSEGEEDSALEIIKEAIKKSPDLIPAVCLASELEKSNRKNKKC